MNEKFAQILYQSHKVAADIIASKVITKWAIQLFDLLYPDRNKSYFTSAESIKSEFYDLEEDLKRILNSNSECKDCNPSETSKKFFEQLENVYFLLNSDLDSILTGDPAAQSKFEIVRVYPGFFAIFFYRIAHLLHQLNVKYIPRILTEYAHSRTGIDIHPGAKIAENFYIDHGTGVVIGETTLIGKNVKIYQGVTLGALFVEKKMQNIKRHPTVEDNVIIYAGATILGGETNIGKNSIIGGNVWLTKSVPPYSTVYHKPNIQVINHQQNAD